MTITIKVEGFAELEEALRTELPKATARSVLTRTGKKALQPVADRMSQLAPYDPEDRDEDGKHLRDTMRVQPAKAKLARSLGTARDQGVIVLAGPGPTGKRARGNAGWQEFGTEKMPAHSYARVAADGLTMSVIDTVKSELKSEIEKAKARIARKAAAKAAKG